MYSQPSNSECIHSYGEKYCSSSFCGIPPGGGMSASWTWNGMCWVFVKEGGNSVCWGIFHLLFPKIMSNGSTGTFPLNYSSSLWGFFFHQNNMADSGWAGNPPDLRAPVWSYSLLCLPSANKLDALDSHTCSKYGNHNCRDWALLRACIVCVCRNLQSSPSSPSASTNKDDGREEEEAKQLITAPVQCFHLHTWSVFQKLAGYWKENWCL